jgi:outer membrane protein assembly factor BamB
MLPEDTSRPAASRSRRRATARHRRGRVRRARLGWTALLAAGAIAAIVAASSGGRSPRRAHRGADTARTVVSVTAAAVGALPAPVQDAAVASLGGSRIAVLGGIVASGGSTAGVTVLDGASPVGAGTLGAPQHDAQAASLGGQVYVFGGGVVASYDHILRYDPASGTTAVAGTLPSPASDVAVAVLGETAYVVGGFDGTHALDTILAWRPGAPARVVGHLPFGLRYAAVAPFEGRLVIAGGSTEKYGVSNSILSFDPATGQVGQVGTLPVPLTHASAASVGGRVYVIGGREQLQGAQSSAIVAIDPATGAARIAGRLPRPLSDAAVLASGGRILVAGGEAGGGEGGGEAGGGGGPQAAILELTPQVRPLVAHPPSGAAATAALAALGTRGLGSALRAHPESIQPYEAAATRTGLPGYLLIADRGNNRILVVDPRGDVVWRYPTTADEAAGRLLHFNDDTFVEPGGRALIANEEDDGAIVSIGIASHSLEVLFGQPGRLGGGPTLLNYPDDAYMLPDGTFTVADAYNCRILFIRAHAIVRQLGASGACRHEPPHAFGAVNGDTPTPEGGFLVSEIPGHWVDGIAANGSLQFAIQPPVSYPSDPQPLPGGRILLADYASPGHVLVLDRRGNVLWRYGPAEGPGALNHPSLAMELPNGDVAVNDDYRDRVVVIDPRTNRIVWQYGHTDTPGTAPGYLNTPDGMDFIPEGPDGEPDWAAVVHP